MLCSRKCGPLFLGGMAGTFLKEHKQRVHLLVHCGVQCPVVSVGVLPSRTLLALCCCSAGAVSSPPFMNNRLSYHHIRRAVGRRAGDSEEFGYPITKKRSPQGGDWPWPVQLWKLAQLQNHPLLVPPGTPLQSWLHAHGLTTPPRGSEALRFT